MRFGRSRFFWGVFLQKNDFSDMEQRAAHRILRTEEGEAWTPCMKRQSEVGGLNLEWSETPFRDQQPGGPGPSGYSLAQNIPGERETTNKAAPVTQMDKLRHLWYFFFLFFF